MVRLPADVRQFAGGRVLAGVSTQQAHAAEARSRGTQQRKATCGSTAPRSACLGAPPSRPPDTVYHFLLPDGVMANHLDKAAQRLEAANPAGSWSRKWTSAQQAASQGPAAWISCSARYAARRRRWPCSWTASNTTEAPRTGIPASAWRWRGPGSRCGRSLAGRLHLDIIRRLDAQTHRRTAASNPPPLSRHAHFGAFGGEIEPRQELLGHIAHQ